jgi:hypothetical protein
LEAVSLVAAMEVCGGYGSVLEMTDEQIARAIRAKVHMDRIARQAFESRERSGVRRGATAMEEIERAMRAGAM